MTATFSRFDAADYLVTEEDIAAYLGATIEAYAETIAAALLTLGRCIPLGRNGEILRTK